ncbi:probable ADP-ribosylation factor GTPase-activating protein AGD14 isoform X4 [Telopea speciosissima]|uniref:probable ADP-ribosylation factor GTPase-activating protein AGD14 isoform X4 n=1 Tax=Telopea speciosissima TaxID=54955 RepID=UPI001CC47763|nr:probable ADP-ribosylation factor GTPase-activating protein AGD14 isoform X4 [Telopea speciosissima]
MSSKKVEERNEKIIRGLMKLPPNRRCINCNSLGPQYVCTNFWTFVCITCSGIHREFTHRVKSVSMATFTSQEVESLQEGGNQRAREIYLKDWDLQRQRLPDSSNVDKIREFIKNVYVDCKYAGGKTSDKPPQNMQNLRNHEDDTRRASSYHSYSQSPPYEYQYEERRYGRQAGALTRKPGSDRGLFERKISSFIYSPGRYEDRIANENSGSRISDYSVSSGGDPFRSDNQSPNFQKNVGYGSPPIQPVRDILNEDVRRQTMRSYSETNARSNVNGVPRPQRTTSSGSFGSFDSNSMSSKSVNSDLFQQPAPSSAPPIDLFGSSQTSSAPSLELFANIAHQQPATNMLEQKQSGFPVAENEGWATFDSPYQVTSTLGTNNVGRATMAHSDGFPMVSFTALASTNTSGKLQSVPSSAAHGSVPPASNMWHGAVQDVQASNSLGSTQSWNAFEDSGQTLSQSSFENLPPRTEPQVQASTGPISTQSWNAFQDSAGAISQTSFGNPPHRNEPQAQAFSGPTSAQQPWNAFEDSAESLSLASFENLPQRNEPQPLAHNPPATTDQYLSLKVQEESCNDGFQRTIVEERAPIHNVPVNGAVAASVLPLVGGLPSHGADRKSTNPFDIPYDSDLEPNSMFLDMSSLQATLPNPQLPPAFLGSLNQPWFPQNPVTPYIPAAPQGGLVYMAGQATSSQLPNIPSQSPVAPLGGNPFA